MTSGWDGTGYYAAQLAPERVRTDWSAPVARAGIVAPRPLQLGDILGGAFRAVRFAPLTMFGLTLVVLMVAQLVGAGTGYVLGRQFGLPLVPFEDADLDTTSLLSWTTITSTLATSLTSIVVGMGLVHTVFEGVSGRRVRPSEALRHMGSRLGAALGYGAVATLAVVAVAAAGFAILTPAFADDSATAALLLFVAFVVGGGLSTWLYVRLLFVPAAIAVERLGPFRAIARSWVLTRRQFWRLGGISVVTSVVISLAAGTVGTVFSFAGLLLAVGNDLALLAMTTASNLTSTVLSLPLSTAVTALLYVDARIRTEGYDLQLSEALYG